MRVKLVALIAGCILNFTRASLCEDSRWQEFTSVKGDFKVLLPGKPKSEKDVEKSGSEITTTYTFSVDREEYYFSVGYSEMGRSEAILPSRFLLDSFRDGMLTDVGTVKLLGEKNITLNKFPGRAVTFRDMDGFTYTTRIYRVKHRIYYLFAMIPLGQEKRSAVTLPRFFNSFTFLGKYPGPTKPMAWTTLDSAKGRFSAQFPGKPSQMTLVDKVGDRLRKANAFSFVSDSALYSIMFFDMSSEAISGGPTKVFDEFQTGLFIGIKQRWNELNQGSLNSSAKPTVIGQRSIFLQGWPGRELRHRDPSGLVHTSRFYLVGSRFYVMDAATAPENVSVSLQSLEKFLNSLKVKPPLDVEETEQEEPVVRDVRLQPQSSGRSIASIYEKLYFQRGQKIYA